MKDQKNIKVKVVSYTLLILVLYYFHEVFRYVEYDVLHIDSYIVGTSFHIGSIFPFHKYPDDVQMDIQFYTWKLSVKLIGFIFAHLIHELVKTLNVLDNPIPGFFGPTLSFVKGLRYFALYQLAIFLFCDSQVSHVYNLMWVAVCFLVPMLRLLNWKHELNGILKGRG